MTTKTQMRILQDLPEGTQIHIERSADRWRAAITYGEYRETMETTSPFSCLKQAAKALNKHTQHVPTLSAGQRREQTDEDDSRPASRSIRKATSAVAWADRQHR